MSEQLGKDAVGSDVPKKDESAADNLSDYTLHNRPSTGRGDRLFPHYAKCPFVPLTVCRSPDSQGNRPDDIALTAHHDGRSDALASRILSPSRISGPTTRRTSYRPKPQRGLQRRCATLVD